MGEPNAALNVYMSKKERIRDVVEYYMGGRIPAGYEISTEDGFYSLKDKGKLTFRERNELKKVQWEEGKGFLLGIENHICMRFIPDEDLEKMASDMKYVIGVLKRTERGKNYQQFILEHADYFKRMPADAYEVIRVCANIKEIKKEFTFHEDDGEERVDMCRAIYEIKRDAKREGKREGKKEGRLEGRREGRCEAILELLEGCGEVPEETKKLIFKEKNTERLGMWLRLAAKAESIEEFYMAM